jgi:hypothetical protein
MEGITQKAGWITAGVLALLVVGALAGVARGGPLDPPGPPASTLSQVEPRIPVQSLPPGGSSLYAITQPGSYYLTSNITGVSGKAGVDISASNVTLDLNGYSLIGTTGTAQGIRGLCGTPCSSVAIHNGTVRDWGLGGIVTDAVRDGLYQDLRLEANGAHGMSAGQESIVERVVADGNVKTGIVLVADPSSSQGGGIVRDSSASNNSRGIEVNKHALVINNELYDNTTEGLRVDDQANRVDANNIAYNGTGIVVPNCCNVIVRNSARGNNNSISAGTSEGPWLFAADLASNGNAHANYAY